MRVLVKSEMGPGFESWSGHVFFLLSFSVTFGGKYWGECHRVHCIGIYSTGNETFISFTLTNVEFRKSRDFFAWILRGSSVGFAWN